MAKKTTTGAEATRRAFLARIGLTGAAVLGVGAASRRAVAAKMPKETAQYQDSPKNGEKCADCVHFVEGDECKLVEGEISPEGWCTLFQAKS